jgi:hypothetical protein
MRSKVLSENLRIPDLLYIESKLRNVEYFCETNYGGKQMDIGALSMVMSQAKLQQSAGIAVMKMAMDNSTEAANQMTEMIKNISADPVLGQNFDVSV